MGMHIIVEEDYSELEKLLIKDGKLWPVASMALEKFSTEQIQLFSYFNAAYQFPTIELIQWLWDFIGDRKAIEIGSGDGSLARALNIPATDNRMQEWSDIKAHYAGMQQPTIKYGEDVECLSWLAAVVKYKPTVVIGCWITQLWKPGDKDGNKHGVDEAQLITLVDHYISLGNKNVHDYKEIYRNVPDTHTLQELKFPWIWSRQKEQDKNRIYIWSKKDCSGTQSTEPDRVL